MRSSFRGLLALVVLVLALVPVTDAAAARAPWARVAERGVRTGVIVWRTTAASAAAPAARKGRGRMVVEAMLPRRGRFRLAARVPVTDRRVVLTSLSARATTTALLRVCRGKACGPLLRVGIRTRKVRQGRNVRPAARLGALPVLGLTDVQLGHSAAFEDDLGALGAGMVRVTYLWDKMMLRRGVVDWGNWNPRRNDEAIRRAHAAGRAVLATIHGYTPDWALDRSQPGLAPRLSAWRQYVDALVARNPDVEYWEVWNEPNNPAPKSVFPLRQLQMAQVVHDVLAARGATGKVVLNLGTGRTKPFGPVEQVAEWAEYIRYGAAYGISGRPFDLLSFHPYNRRHDVGVVAPGTYGLERYATGDIGRLIDAVDRAFPGEQIPVAISEFSFVTGGGRIHPSLTDQGQADALCAMLSELRRWSGAGRIPFAIWYQLEDEVGEDGWTSGLRRRDGSAKPSFAAWQAYAAAPPATWSPRCA